MRLLDTDVMIDIQRGYQPAVDWLSTLDEPPGLPGFVVLELMQGCRDKREMISLRQYLGTFVIHWPNEGSCTAAVADFAQGHLSHNLGVIDAIVGHTAVGVGATLCTFNQKHYRAVSRLQTEQPYARSPRTPRAKRS